MAQSQYFSNEMLFVKYLQSKDLAQESLSVLHGIDTNNLEVTQKDSINYELAWTYYTLKKLSNAAFYFNKISNNDSRKLKSLFFESYCQCYIKKLDSCQLILENLKLNDSVYNELRYFELAGVSLLKKEFKQFENYSSYFSYTQYAFENEERKLVEYKNAINSKRKKSPFIAATLSAIIPGAGKWYAGKKKEAIGAFLPILATGFLALEGYNKGGVNDARFLIFGSLFTTFYIGNIWGSSFAVKIAQSEFQEKYENKILFDLHIPLRILFN
jgi:hypothetical protein